MIIEPKCYTRKCIHFIGVNEVEEEEDQKVICEAFPEGIPAEIAYGNNKHLKPLAGQINEIVFET